MGSPVKSARKVPLVPRLTSVKEPRIRGVKGVPDSTVKLPLTLQSPKTLEAVLFVFSHFLFCPKGSSKLKSPVS